VQIQQFSKFHVVVIAVFTLIIFRLV